MPGNSENLYTSTFRLKPSQGTGGRGYLNPILTHRYVVRKTFDYYGRMPEKKDKVDRGNICATSQNGHHIAPEISELMYVWLCNAHALVSEGMRDPVTVIELMCWLDIIEKANPLCSDPGRTTASCILAGKSEEWISLSGPLAGECCLSDNNKLYKRVNALITSWVEMGLVTRSTSWRQGEERRPLYYQGFDAEVQYQEPDDIFDVKFRRIRVSVPFFTGFTNVKASSTVPKRHCMWVNTGFAAVVEPRPNPLSEFAHMDRSIIQASPTLEDDLHDAKIEEPSGANIQYGGLQTNPVGFYLNLVGCCDSNAIQRQARIKQHLAEKCKNTCYFYVKNAIEDDLRGSYVRFVLPHFSAEGPGTVCYSYRHELPRAWNFAEPVFALSIVDESEVIMKNYFLENGEFHSCPDATILLAHDRDELSEFDEADVEVLCRSLIEHHRRRRNSTTTVRQLSIRDDAASTAVWNDADSEVDDKENTQPRGGSGEFLVLQPVDEH